MPKFNKLVKKDSLIKAKKFAVAKAKEFSGGFETPFYSIHENAVYIKPLDEDVKLEKRDLLDERSSKFWESHRKPYVGQILFSKEPIDRIFEDDNFVETFKPGDFIYGRAIWETAIRNIPIGYNGSQPVYGPTVIVSDYGVQLFYRVDFFLKAIINGEPVVRPLETYGDEVKGDYLAVSSEVGPGPKSLNLRHPTDKFEPNGEVTDFYAFNQSMALWILSEDPEVENSWEAGVPVFSKALSKLKPGKHEVEIQLCYRICCDIQNIERYDSFKDTDRSEIMLRKDTKISKPLSSGKFIFEMPEGGAKESYLSPFPKRTDCSLSEKEMDNIESIIFDCMTNSGEWGRNPKAEQIIHVAIRGNWSRLNKRNKLDQDEPWRFTIPFFASVYRSPLKGWECEKNIKVFKLGCVSYQDSISTKSDIIGISVHGNYEFEVDSVPEDHWEKCGVKRAPENLRSGLV